MAALRRPFPRCCHLFQGCFTSIHLKMESQVCYKFIIHKVSSKMLIYSFSKIMFSFAKEELGK